MAKKPQDFSSIDVMRHSAAHLMAAAIAALFPGTKFGVGPVIDYGFYYDVEAPRPLTADDLPAIEAKMKEMQSAKVEFVRQEMSLPEAVEFFAGRGQDYKVDLLKDLAARGTTSLSAEEMKDFDAAQPQVVSVYVTGDFVDLCRGPHVDNAVAIKVFALTKIAGAYWRGKEGNAQLQRIYGLCFAEQKELDAHLAMLEEARRRDHKKLGPELDLFTFSDLVGAGLPLWTPRGTILRNVLDGFVWRLRAARGYERVEIPHITKKELYEISGHWEKFKDELFKITTREGHLLAMKPMNCPHHTQIYARKKWSYRDLPQRYANTTVCYRDEQTGELSGLSRTRAFTQDDAHVFCRLAQAKEEFLKIWDIIFDFYGAFGFELSVRLSLHDPAHLEKYLGGAVKWQIAEKMLRDIVAAKGVAAKEVIGEAAFYGPKLDFLAKDSLGREWQVATIQLDMNMPERFDLSCVAEDGQDERIVMIHAAIMGSIERFLSIAIEHFAGAFPLWLAPEQIRLATVAANFVPAARVWQEKLLAAGLRVELDASNEKVGKKIRDAAMMKIPWTIVLGAKEIAGGDFTINVFGQTENLVLAQSSLVDEAVKAAAAP